MDNERPTPRDTDVPGGFPTTPSMASITTRDGPTPLSLGLADDRDRTPTETNATPGTSNRGENHYFAPIAGSKDPQTGTSSSSTTLPPSPQDQRHHNSAGALAGYSTSRDEPSASTDGKPRELDDSGPELEPIKTNRSNADHPGLEKQKSGRTEDDIFRALTRRRTNATEKSQVEEDEESEEINRLMSRMFGKARQEQSEEENTRHSGVVFRDLTVKGVGLGASLQPTVGDIFLGLPRTLKALFTKGPKAAMAKPPVRELISHFDGCVRPGELLLVLGRPGSGCTTFLKTFCNQRSGFAGVEGDVTYGGVSAEEIAKNYRGEVIYQPEDDLHYPSLTVERTLKFALETRTPGKESRLEGETREQYISEFLRIVTKLFWIEHTLGKPTRTTCCVYIDTNGSQAQKSETSSFVVFRVVSANVSVSRKP